MTASLLSPAQTSALSTLPLLSARVLLSLLNSLYAEPGYSATSAADIAKDIGEPVSRVKGAVSSLVQKDLVEAVDMQANDEVLPLLYSDLHRDSADVSGDDIRAEAVAMLRARLDSFIDGWAEGKTTEQMESPVVEAVRDAVATTTGELEDLAMIAIFGRKAGLGWPVIVAAMGKGLSFTHRLRPVMKRMDPSSVAKMGPAYSSAYREA
jgi:hypothetical protein